MKAKNEILFLSINISRGIDKIFDTYFRIIKSNPYNKGQKNCCTNMYL